LNGAEHWTVRNVIRYSWKVLKFDAGERLTDCVRDKVSHRDKEERNILQRV